MVKFLDLKAQYLQIKDEIDHVIRDVIETSAFVGGQYLADFERNFASFQGASHCIGVGNGTDALEIALEALELPIGSEVIVPANSFIASAEAVTRCGHRVVFCDVDPRRYVVDPDDVARRITSKTRAIMAVHLYGQPCDMTALKKLASQNDLYIIEDCAQAHGAEFEGERVGALGTIGCFSFYPGKNLGAYGDGGAIVTHNEPLARRCRMIANHGRLAKYNHEFEGRNSRLDGLQAAILGVKLKHLEKWTNQRIALADEYLDGLKNIPDLILPERAVNVRQVYHLFVVRTERRDALRAFLAERDIQTGIHYPHALPKLPAYEYLDQQTEEGAAWVQDETLLSLPIGEHLATVAPVIEAIREFFDVR